MIRHVDKTVVTDGSGDAEVYAENVFGLLKAIQYIKTDYADTVDFTITDETTGINLWTQANQLAAAVKYPRVLAQSGVGADLTGWYAEPVIATRIKIVLAAGGATKTGVFRFIFDDCAG